MLLVIWTVVSLVTLLIEIVPGDPATVILGETATQEQIQNFRTKHGLDRPAFSFHTMPIMDLSGTAATIVTPITLSDYFTVTSERRFEPSVRSGI